MIYSNKKIVIEGRDGCIKDYVFRPTTQVNTASNNEQEPSQKADPALLLGEVDGRMYRYFPDDFDINQAGEQYPEIDFKKEDNLAPEIKLALRSLPFARNMKDNARQLIEANIGDPLDLLAQLGFLVETAVVSSCVVIGMASGKYQPTEEQLGKYGERALAVLQAIQSGVLTLRSDFEKPEEMITKIIPAYSELQKIVRDHYVNPMKDLGL